MGVHFNEPPHGTIHERIKHLITVLADGKNTVFAEKLGVNEANIRGYIKNVIPKADFLAKLVITYDINAMWLLTGAGNTVRGFNEQPEQPLVLTDNPSIADFFKQFEPYIQRKDAKIIQQAEEIGRLKERLAILERERELIFAQREKTPEMEDAQGAIAVAK